MSNPNSKPHIYVVDDSPDLGEMLEVFLNSAGYPTSVFNDPLVALAALGSSGPQPDLLVSDFHMPGINGLELIHRCRLIHPKLKIIAASAHILEEELEKYPVQPDRILPKPYTTSELLQTVQALLAE
ncbi:MAG TPA: response regulator [Verrucomicrobiae bacterium]|nr:response regulator [Verrucomicrobiae bacterium]